MKITCKQPFKVKGKINQNKITALKKKNNPILSAYHNLTIKLYRISIIQ